MWSAPLLPFLQGPLWCDTMWVVRQADDPFVCFGAKQNKGLSSRSSTRPKVGKRTPEKAVGKGNPEKAVGEG